MIELIRFRHNTMADQTPGGEWKWRVIFERDEKFEEVLVNRLLVNVPFLQPRRRNAGRRQKVSYGLPCVFRTEDGVGIINAKAE